MLKNKIFNFLKYIWISFNEIKYEKKKKVKSLGVSPSDFSFGPYINKIDIFFLFFLVWNDPFHRFHVQVQLSFFNWVVSSVSVFSFVFLFFFRVFLIYLLLFLCGTTVSVCMINLCRWLRHQTILFIHMLHVWNIMYFSYFKILNMYFWVIIWISSHPLKFLSFFILSFFLSDMDQ